MAKRTAILSIVAAMMFGVFLGFAFAAWQPRNKPAVNPLTSARDYVFTHYPKRYPAKGKYLSYYVSDHRDAWIVEVSNQGEIGGGVRLLVIKQSGVVNLVGFSQ